MTTGLLDKIKALCAIDDDADDAHWIWRGRTTNGGHPIIWHQGRVHMTRRLVLQARDGRALASCYVAACTCDEPLCVAPGCVQGMSTKNARQLAAQRGAYTGNPLRAARIARTRRARSAVSDAVVQQIRLSTTPTNALARELQLQPSYISDVRTGKIRRELSTPWAGAGARP